ncbi:peptidoglycan-binding domain-containing protein [Mucilaginibacter sp. McL0603]|uniref:peptidoglycan-binding domain-containing protein n=1 Tax=Mucilaginibacter sp. McL0603 TaxID=3415670 RepID=UPI003CE84797
MQSWLNLFAHNHPAAGTATGIDGIFGPGTAHAVTNFQAANQLDTSGIVDAALFGLLCGPINEAFSATSPGTGLRQIIVDIAQAHLAQRPFELVINGQSNSGPWVRSYMGGNEGTAWFWCMGFAQTILDQAASQQGKDFRNLMPLSFSCDEVGNHGKHSGALIDSGDIRNNPGLVHPGDLFLLRRPISGWHHTGVIAAVGDTFFETLEGNTNTDGSPNGDGVYKRTRSFQNQLLDVFSIQTLV